jgi:hypothetical protein
VAFDVGTLRPDLLYLVVFGPGYGESIVLRVPPDHWMVVDSTQLPMRRGINPAAQLLEREGGEWRCMVLSHPHEDHAVGFDVLLDQPGSGPIGCVERNLDVAPVDEHHPDAERQLRSGTTQAALAAIRDRWERFPNRRWALSAGASTTVGSARVEVLSPDASTTSSANPSPNALASAIVIEWQDHRWLLGADLERPGWEIIASIHGATLADHVAFKVAHHGSAGAQHDAVMNGARTRVWVLTPWRRGKALPRLERDEGLARLLRHVDGVTLTSAPSTALGLPTAARLTVAELRDAIDAARTHVAVSPLPTTNDTEQGWAAFGWNHDGALVDEQRGASAIVVVRGQREQ